MYYQLFKHVLLGPGLKVYYHPWSEGLENVPEEGAAILASNHLSFSDSIFLPLVMKRKVVFLGKAEYFTGKGIKGAATRAFMEGVGTIPVHRGGGRVFGGRVAYGHAGSRGGELLGIYPEGTRSPDGRLYRGKTGVARLAIEAGVPVLPVAMIGTDVAQPVGKKVPVAGRDGRAHRRTHRHHRVCRASKMTARRCAKSPTRSCAPSRSSPARNTLTATRRSTSALSQLKSATHAKRATPSVVAGPASRRSDRRSPLE